ncbi:MAG: dihydroorotate dehydrogenase electron transfer subunit [Bacillota bacterium]|jgi:dihydroorotate dehydrogenase electron transfer subunit|nr:dihydroorotate dehydrogenase electron transfer subunit [Bacillota bacterium]
MTGFEPRILESKILGNDCIAREIYRLTLKYDNAEVKIKPGQFVNLYLNDKSMILPRPVSVCEAGNDRLTLVYRVVGKGTEALSGYAPGEMIRVSTPLGNGYDISDVVSTVKGASKKIVLAAGGLGVPPMIELAKTLRNEIEGRADNSATPDTSAASNTGATASLPDTDKKPEIVAVVGFQDEVFLKEELERFCHRVLVATDSGISGFHGNVVELMKTFEQPGDYYLACGPKLMLKAVSEYCLEKNLPIQVSLEERMGCGYGACVGCTCKIKEDHESVKLKKVCKDGPVFRGNEVVWDD